MFEVADFLSARHELQALRNVLVRFVVKVAVMPDLETFGIAPIRAFRAIDALLLFALRCCEIFRGKANNRNRGNWGLWLDPTLLRETEANK